MSRCMVCLSLGLLMLVGCSGKPEPAVAPSGAQTSPAAPGNSGEQPIIDPSTPAENPNHSVSTPAMKMPTVPAGAPAASPTTPAATPAATTAVPTDDALSAYVSDEAVIALSVRPAAIASHPVVKKLFEMADRLPGSKATENLERFKEQTGISPNDLQRIIVAVSLEEIMSLPAAMLGGFPPSIPVAVIELATAEATSSLYDSAPSNADVEIGGHKGKSVDDRLHVLRVSETQLLVGSQERLEKAVAKGTPGGLAQRLMSANGQQLTLAVDVAALNPAVQQISQQAGPNPAAMIVLGITQQLKALDVSLSLEGDSLLSGNIETINADSAQGLQQMLGGLVAQGTNQVQKARDEAQGSRPEGVPLLNMALAALQSLKVSVNDAKITLNMPRPEGLDQLPELLEPMYSEASKAADNSRRMNNLKQIGLAFHNYHDVWNHFPAADSNGEDGNGRKGAGLSWRVHLLPYLDQAALYNEFNFDEPWDSEHNSALIPRIPALFANSPEEGKTSLHVFVGDEGAFRLGQKAMGIRDIIDGTSNTILAVEAGADTAEIWTKPGGLEISAEDPLKPLGKIGEKFLVLMMDGSVHHVPSNLPGETLHNMIRPAEGNPVPVLR